MIPSLIPRRLLPALLILAFVLQAAPPPADPAKAGMDPAQLGRLSARMKAFVDKGTIAGAVTLIQRHGAVALLDAVGYQDLENKKPMAADTIFQIMSMTKPVTAIGIMMLAEEGKLSVSDPVEKHLPEFRGLWMVESRGEKSLILKRPSRSITLRDLLTHTSGMNSGPPAGLKELLFKMDKTLAEAVSVYSQQPLDFEPGTKWQYSNPGIATLGRIIEVASGLSFEKFLEERIFKPLGMKDSFIFPPADRRPRIAMVYRLENGKLVEAKSDTLGGSPWEYRTGAKYSGPEYAMFSTASDLAALYQMMLNGGSYQGKRLLSRASVEAMTTLHTGELEAGHSSGMGYGLAWTVVKDPIATTNFRSLGTYGHGGAFGTQGWIDPKKDLVGVFMIQRSAGGGSDESNAVMTMAGAAIVE